MNDNLSPDWRERFEQQRAAADKELCSEIATAEKRNRLVYAKSHLPLYTQRQPAWTQTARPDEDE